MRPMTITSAAVCAIVAALAAAGCGGANGNDKAGGSGTPVTMRIATPDRPGAPGSKAIERFRDQVAKLSDGAVRITPVYRAAGTAPRFDEVVADLVRDRKVEMALIPARVWDEYGVTSFQALQAPFLIRDQALLDEVAAGELATRMMHGLRGTGVTGLVMLPEGLRHPFGFTGPLRSPQDFAGAAVRAPRSKATYALLKALGAKPNDLAGDELTAAVGDGRLAGAESAFEIAHQTLPGIPTGTGNVTFFPKVNVLVANSDALRALSKSARSAVDTAAARTRDWIRHTNKDEREAALAYCGAGGRVVAARPEDAKRLVALSEPVYTALERNATTKQLIEAIRALARHQGAANTKSVTCEPAARRAEEPPEAGAGPATDPHVLDGVYRHRTTAAELRAKGIDEELLYNHGIHTITLNGGHLEDHQIDPEHPSIDEPCTGTYKLSGHSFAFKWDRGNTCTGDFTATWQLSNGELRFTSVHSPDRFDEVWWSIKPFRKIG